MPEKIVAIAGGTGFIGRAIARRLAGMPDTRVRAMSRSPERARQRLNLPNLDGSAPRSPSRPHCRTLFRERRPR